jgi:hypothetical protein
VNDAQACAWFDLESIFGEVGLASSVTSVQVHEKRDPSRRKMLRSSGVVVRLKVLAVFVPD